MPERDPIEFYPLTKERWEDFEQLFGPSGACGGCWCMWWRLKRSEFERCKGEDNHRAMRAIVASGEVPGILAYRGMDPVGWCSVAPRDSFPVLDRSRVLKPVDTLPVWSIVCFFIDKRHRRQGLSGKLIRAAVAHATKAGATIIEAYPIEPKAGQRPAPAFVYTGLASAFKQAGFVEVARRSQTRPIMRYSASASPPC
jgi:GNAT superfamily N-acetyltransferase